MKVRIGTRGSDLALWQANHVAGRLRAAGATVEVVVMVTRGDRIDDVPLQNVEGKAFFTKEIEDALLSGEVDVAVHSHKDLPVEGPPGLLVVAVPERAAPGERLLVSTEAYLEHGALLPIRLGARVGTSAPRRQAQLEALRPDLEIVDLRGNVPTRVQRLREGRYDAIVLAAAGLDRLGLDLSGLEVVELPPELVVPAPGQGALAIQVRADDAPVARLVRETLDDATTRAVIEAERRLLQVAGGGCNLALGAALRRDDEADVWHAQVFRGPDATDAARTPRWAGASSTDPVAAAEAALEAAQGEGPTHAGPLGGLVVAVTGASGGRTNLGSRLASLGADVRHEVVLQREDVPGVDLAADVGALGPGDAIAVTSRRAAPHLAGLGMPDGVLVAAVGPATAAALREHGVEVHLVGRGGARELARELPIEAGARVLHPSAVDPLGDLEAELLPRGVEVRRVAVYRTRAVEDPVLDPDVDVRVYMSPSAVRASLAWERANPGSRTTRVALGASTSEALQEVGLSAFSPAEGDREGIVRFLYDRHEQEPERSGEEVLQ